MGEVEPTSNGSASPVGQAPRWLVAIVVVLFVAVLVCAATLGQHKLARDRAEDDPRVRILREAVQEHPGDVAARRELAFAYQQSGRDAEALREYDRVISLQPKDLAALYNKGVVCLQMGREQEGERSLLQVLALDSSHGLAAKALGERYASSGEYRQLAKVITPAANAHPALADLQYLAGLGYEKTGDSDEAQVRYRRALALVPDMTVAQEALERLEATK